MERFKVVTGEKSGNFICICPNGSVFYFGNGWSIPYAIVIRPNGASFLNEVEAAGIELREGEVIYTFSGREG